MGNSYFQYQVNRREWNLCGIRWKYSCVQKGGFWHFQSRFYLN